MQVSAYVLEDDIPEDTESFVMELANPRDGAEIGANKEVTVNILTNDDGHGIIQFAKVFRVYNFSYMKLMISFLLLLKPLYEYHHLFATTIFYVKQNKCAVFINSSKKEARRWRCFTFMYLLVLSEFIPIC